MQFAWDLWARFLSRRKRRCLHANGFQSISSSPKKASEPHRGLGGPHFYETRYPSLQFNTGGGGSQSYTRSGVMIPAESRPSKIFAKLFLDGSPEEIQSQMRKLHEGRSIMDTLGEEAERLEKRFGSADRDKLDEYFTSVREMEQRLQKSEDWVQKPKPKIDVKQPQDIQDEKDLIGRMNLLFDLIPLAFQTDSTRLITMVVQGRGDVPTIPGVKADHHNLSHHGQDPAEPHRGLCGPL